MGYASLMYEFQKCFGEFKFLMNKIEAQQITGKPVSKRSNLILRNKTIEIEKFGKQFRALTIQMDKKRNARSK